MSLSESEYDTLSRNTNAAFHNDARDIHLL
jgi:hypothetical protein